MTSYLNALTKKTPIVLDWPKKAIVAILVILVVLLVYGYTRALGDVDAGLYGFWAIDDDFAEKAFIDAMYVYIEPPGRSAKNDIGISGATCNMYFVIKTDGAMAFNERLSVAIHRKTAWLGGVYRYELRMPKAVTCIPKKIMAEFDPAANMLTLRDSKTMYARLFRRPELSFYATMDATGTGAESAVDSDDDADEPEPVKKEAADDANDANNVD